MTLERTAGIAPPHTPEPPQALEALWRDRRGEGAEAARQRLAAHYRPFARMLAARCYRHRFSLELEFDDYAQCAMLGLLEAIERFDPTQNVAFESFAGSRITGAVLDGVESLSEKQRQIATRTRARRERTASLQAGGATDVVATTPLQRLADIAVGLAIGFMLENAAVYVDGEATDPVATPYERLEMEQLRRRILELVDRLPDAERRVVRHHYLQQIPFDQIAQSCGLTKGRISQIHRAALERLRRLVAAGDGTVLIT